jgi:pSer/pThr/pTyr-binding forkhead associated (FHA) protein
MEQTFPLPLTIGREADNHLILLTTSVSRHHAEVVQDEEKVVITDLGSANGSYLNGSRIEKATIKDGDELIVGDVKIVVAFAKERRSSQRPSMDHLYGALSDGEAQPTITIRSIKGRSGLFADMGSTAKPAESPSSTESPKPAEVDPLSGDDLKSFISGRLQKDVDQDISEDVDKVAATYERRQKPEVPSPAPPHAKESSQEEPPKPSGIMGFFRRLLGG